MWVASKKEGTTVRYDPMSYKTKRVQRALPELSTRVLNNALKEENRACCSTLKSLPYAVIGHLTIREMRQILAVKPVMAG